MSRGFSIGLFAVSYMFSLGANAEEAVKINGKAPVGSCDISSQVTGSFSYALGNRAGKNNIKGTIANLTTNETFRICGNDWQDNTKMVIYYTRVGGVAGSEPVTKNSCIFIDAATITSEAILGAGTKKGEDNVSGTVMVCNLGNK